MGLGGWPLTSLAKAREIAFENRRLARSGGNPLAEKRKARTPTFEEAAERTWDALEAATRCLRDEDYRVRRNAAIALRHAAAPAAETVPGLVEMLGDENRYNRFYAADGLRRLASVSPEAEAGLMDHLFTSHWCPLTTPDNPY